MHMLTLNPTQQTTLDELNATGDPDRQLIAVPLVAGGTALNADLLTDCAEGQTWQHYRAFLQSLPTIELTLAEILEPQLT